MRLPSLLASLFLGLSLPACDSTPPPPGGGPAAIATVVGRCVDGSGAPVADASVHWANAGSVASDADGRFRLELPFDPHLAPLDALISIEKDGFTRLDVQVQAAAGETKDLGELPLE